MILDGAVLKVNEMLDPNPVTSPADSRRATSSHKPRLSHVSPMTRAEAELYLTTCRQITRGCKELVLWKLLPSLCFRILLVLYFYIFSNKISIKFSVLIFFLCWLSFHLNLSWQFKSLNNSFGRKFSLKFVYYRLNSQQVDVMTSKTEDRVLIIIS